MPFFNLIALKTRKQHLSLCTSVTDYLPLSDKPILNNRFHFNSHSKWRLDLTVYINTFKVYLSCCFYTFNILIGLVWSMVFSATFNNISDIPWRSVLLMKETRVHGENHWPATSHWQTLSHNVVSGNMLFVLYYATFSRLSPEYMWGLKFH